MPAGRYDFTIEQGADFDRVLTCKDAAGNLIDFTGLNARLDRPAARRWRELRLGRQLTVRVQAGGTLMRTAGLA